MGVYPCCFWHLWLMALPKRKTFKLIKRWLISLTPCAKSQKLTLFFWNKGENLSLSIHSHEVMLNTFFGWPPCHQLDSQVSQEWLLRSTNKEGPRSGKLSWNLIEFTKVHGSCFPLSGSFKSCDPQTWYQCFKTFNLGNKLRFVCSFVSGP